MSPFISMYLFSGQYITAPYAVHFSICAPHLHAGRWGATTPKKQRDFLFKKLAVFYIPWDILNLDFRALSVKGGNIPLQNRLYILL